MSISNTVLAAMVNGTHRATGKAYDIALELEDITTKVSSLTGYQDVVFASTGNGIAVLQTKPVYFAVPANKRVHSVRVRRKAAEGFTGVTITMYYADLEISQDFIDGGTLTVDDLEYTLSFQIGT